MALRIFTKYWCFTPISTTWSRIASVGYAKKVAAGGAKGASAARNVDKKKLDHENDPEKLLTYCCGLNIYKEGEDPKLKQDSEYPDWLWKLNVERENTPLDELDKDSWTYWRRMRRLANKRKYNLGYEERKFNSK
ncbi:unnamed protein product [Owenia fusiformis]|uniref:Large ribosomal subunit protein mL54 n=1 Tax=Owenia fusiformis TaxID=6347 RepID=A0A8J1XXW2_OWEFU|nr:unnamed protein product [Owenia fusiformis]